MRSLVKFAPLALVLGLAACGTTTTERASTGAIGGAIAGAVLGGDLAGAAVGGAAGAAIGAATTDRRGRDYCRYNPCER